MTKRIHFKVEGIVQGVFYRKYTIQKAETLGICGWVRNRSDGSVEIVALGDEERVDAFVDWCHSEGSPESKVMALEELPWDDSLPVIDSNFRKEKTL